MWYLGRTENVYEMQDLMHVNEAGDNNVQALGLSKKKTQKDIMCIWKGLELGRKC